MLEVYEHMETWGCLTCDRHEDQWDGDMYDPECEINHYCRDGNPLTGRTLIDCMDKCPVKEAQNA